MHSNVADELHAMLEDIVHKNWLNAHFSREHFADYWKIEGNKEIVFGITYFPPILVCNFIRLFKLDWHYTESPNFNAGSFQQNLLDESAIWSKICSSQEVFLLPIIEWVHVYTWVE